MCLKNDVTNQKCFNGSYPSKQLNKSHVTHASHESIACNDIPDIVCKQLNSTFSVLHNHISPLRTKFYNRNWHLIKFFDSPRKNKK